ncbi:MAG: DUF4397 domain-containing protein [Chloroflexota bacterium]
MKKYSYYNRKILFGMLFATLIALASLGSILGTASATNGPDVNATIPPPGGTLPRSGSGIKLIHLAPFDDDPIVSAQLSGAGTVIQYNNLDLGSATTGYLNVTPGTVSVNISSTTGTSVSLSNQVAIDTDYTYAVIGGANGWPVEIWPLVDTTLVPDSGTGKVRIVHVAPFAPKPTDNELPTDTQVNIVTQSGERVDSAFEGLLYQESSSFVTMPAGIYDWKVVLPSGDVLVDLPIFQLFNKAVVTLYIVGDGDVQSPAGLLVINETGEEIIYLYMAAIRWQN